jgi:crotonobetainyl-CoA:carnitine CoA-transferase CaiB-like acyl-CoA transferase
MDERSSSPESGGRLSDGGGAGPLAGLRVLDLTRVIMGPYATQILADQGADVILIEASDGDTCRVMGPGPHPELSGIALNLLRNKRSVETDLKSVAGRELIERIVPSCDVVVTTMRPQALRRLGLDYQSLSRLRPDVVYCQAQGYPLGSPRAEEPAYDDTIQVASGVADMMERVWGQSSLLPTILADKVCGLIVAQAVCAALVHRALTGVGQHVEVAMQEATSAFMLVEHGSGAIPEPPVRQDDSPAAGYPRVLTPERRPHATKDGQVHLFPYLPKHYAAVFRKAGRAGADLDPRYADQRAALRNSDSLYKDIRLIAPRFTTHEWLEYCRELGIPATKVVTLQDMVNELPIVDHSVAGRYRIIPPTARFDRTPASVRREAPVIGEHTDELMTELGIANRVAR